MFKVYFYIPSLATGGAEKQCSLIAGNMAKRGYDVSVIVNDGSKISSHNRELLEGVVVKELPKGFFCRLWTLVALMRQDKKGIVFACLANSNFLASLCSLFVRDWRIYCGIRCGRLPWWKHLIEIISNRCLATGTIFNSYRSYREFINRGFSRKNSMVISNAFYSRSSLERPRHSGINIVTVGRFTVEKDYHTWLSVVRHVLDMGYSVRALIEGYGKEERAIKQWVKDMCLSEIVTFYPGNYNVDALLAIGDIYLSTSLAEGVSNSILEAMNAGLPVVATNVGDNDIMIEDGISGFLASAGDVCGLAAGVTKLIQDDGMRSAFAERARTILREKYSLCSVLEQYELLIGENGVKFNS